jgi:RHS repeat-associated protein
VASVTETSDAAAVYPPALTQTATYNNLNQLTVLSGQALTWSTVGNLTADGTRTYTWDAENRLVGIGYPAQPGKATAFAYDGLGRRVSITETPPGGGTPVTTRYLWCGDALCQARDGSNAPTRSYYDEGEFVPGSPGQPHYYGVDQLGSVRRAFASTTSAPAFNYDPYGSPLTGPAPTTDFGFAGLFNHQPSGLNLTWFRVYHPTTARWLSRDPLAEWGDPYGNLYPYVAGDSPSKTDPLGLIGTSRNEAVSAFSRADDQCRPASLGLVDKGQLQNVRPAAPDDGVPNNIGLLSSKSPKLSCQNVLCGAPTGGAVYPLCPSCNDRLKNNGPPILLENGKIIRIPIEPKY